MLRHEHDILWKLQSGGILTVMTKAGRVQQRTLKQDVFRSRPQTVARVAFGARKLPERPFVLSCQGPGQICSFQPAAFYLRQMLKADAMDLLKAMTLWPAQAQGLKDRGVIEKANWVTCWCSGCRIWMRSMTSRIWAASGGS